MKIKSIFILTLCSFNHIKLAEKEESKKSQEHVTIYHTPYNSHTGFESDLFESIKQHGLCSRNELYKRGLIKKAPPEYAMSPGHYNLVYFAYDSRRYIEINKDWIGIKVDPETTYVHNKELRLLNKPYLYNESKMKLSVYLQQLEKAKVLQEQLKKENRPGFILFNPFTAEPFVNDGRKCQICRKNNCDHQLYLNEIIFETPCIPADTLTFSKKEDRDKIQNLISSLFKEYKKQC